MKIFVKTVPLIAVLAALSPVAASAADIHSTTTTTTNSSQSGNTESWKTQNNYWRENYTKRPYYSKDRQYEAYEPAYRYGVELYDKNPGKRYQDLDQSEISRSWSLARNNSTLEWNDAQVATRDAYDHMYNAKNSTAAR